MHPDLEKMRVKDVPWSTMNPRDKGPRWVVVAVDNVAMGWSDISREPNLEAYISLYVFDAWRVYRYCSPQKMFQLYGCCHAAWVREGTDDKERERVQDEWEIGVERDDPMINVEDMERDGSAWVVIRTYPDDGECDDGDEEEYNKYVDGIIEGVMCNPPC